MPRDRKIVMKKMCELCELSKNWKPINFFIPIMIKKNPYTNK